MSILNKLKNGWCTEWSLNYGCPGVSNVLQVILFAKKNAQLLYINEHFLWKFLLKIKLYLSADYTLYLSYVILTRSWILKNFHEGLPGIKIIWLWNISIFFLQIFNMFLQSLQNVKNNQPTNQRTNPSTFYNTDHIRSMLYQLYFNFFFFKEGVFYFSWHTASFNYVLPIILLINF